MAGVNTSFDVALMHAILYVKLHFEVGSAFESTVHAVAHGGLGKVSVLFQEILEDLHEGVDYRVSLERVGRKSNHEGFLALTTALASPPTLAAGRLEEVADLLQARKVTQVEVYHSRVDRVVRFATITFLGSFALLLVKLAGSIETNSILPKLDVASNTVQLGYATLGLMLVLCLLAMLPGRSR